MNHRSIKVPQRPHNRMFLTKMPPFFLPKVVTALSILLGTLFMVHFSIEPLHLATRVSINHVERGSEATVSTDTLPTPHVAMQSPMVEAVHASVRYQPAKGLRQSLVRAFEAAAASVVAAHRATEGGALVSRATSITSMGTFEQLQAWGLDPAPDEIRSGLPPSARTVAPSADESTWSRSRIRVRSSKQPLDAMEAKSAHTPRSEGESIRRMVWAHKCMKLNARPGEEPLSSPGGMTIRPDVLSDHCNQVNHDIGAWLEENANSFGLTVNGKSAYPPADWAWYAGPWIEDYWIATFGRPVRRRMPIRPFFAGLGRHYLRPVNATTGESMPVDKLQALWEAGATDVDVEAPFDSDLFHPFCPLFVPWENVMVHSLVHARQWAPVESLAALLSSSLRPDMMYVTVVQRAAGPLLLKDSGLPGAGPLATALRNVLILSSGGTGHVPLPLLAKELPLLRAASGISDNAQSRAHTHALAFIGARRTGSRSAVMSIIQSHALMQHAHGVVMQPLQLQEALLNAESGPALLHGWGMMPPEETAKESGTADSETASWYRNIELDGVIVARALALALCPSTWIRVMAGAAYALAPRGTGPTSFRLYEALQMGRPPVYVYSDYEKLSKTGLISTVDEHGVQSSTAWLPYMKRGHSAAWVDGLPASNQSLWARVGYVFPESEVESWLTKLHAGWHMDGSSEVELMKVRSAQEGANGAEPASMPQPRSGRIRNGRHLRESTPQGQAEDEIRDRQGDGGSGAGNEIDKGTYDGQLGIATRGQSPGGRRVLAGALGSQGQNTYTSNARVPVRGSEYMEKLRAIAQVRETHFTYAGVMAHIAEFLHDPETSELDCHFGS